MGLPLWAYILAAVFWGVIAWRRRRIKRAGQIVSAVEGRHRPIQGGGL